MKSRCELCDTDQEVRYEPTRYRLENGYYYETGARCIDRKSCRLRVEEKGQPWLVLDPEDMVTNQ